MDVEVMQTVIGRLSDDELAELNSLVQAEIASRKPSLPKDEAKIQVDPRNATAI